MSMNYADFYRVKATGEVLETVTWWRQEDISSLFATDREWNVKAIRLLDQETGEIRTFRLDAVEPAGG